MKTQRYLLPILLAVSFVLTACPKNTLTPGGAYNGDKTLYDADQIANAAGATMVAFVTWEHANRDALAATPAIRKLSAQVDLQGKQWLASYFAVRDAYVAAAPADKSKYSLSNALAPITAALGQIAIYMAAPVPTPAAPTPAVTPSAP